MCKSTSFAPEQIFLAKSAISVLAIQSATQYLILKYRKVDENLNPNPIQQGKQRGLLWSKTKTLHLNPSDLKHRL